MDPEIKKYFKKIINSFVFGFLWLFTNSTAGLYYKLGILSEGIRWYNIAFYALLVSTLLLLVRFYYFYWRVKASDAV